MDPIKPKFFQTAFDLIHGDNSLSLRGLVAQSGITKIHFSTELPPFWKAVLGSVVTVKIDAITLSGVFLQQHVEHGTFYEVKFRGLTEPQREYLEQRVNTDGISPGWQRKYPRIPVKGLDDPELPLPSLCMVRFVGQEIFVNVVNFTLGGIRIETLGDALGELRVGSLLHFDLVTTAGEVMTNLSAEVRNIAVHKFQGPGGEVQLTRSFGLRFIDMDPVNERKYRALIREFCTVLRKRFEEDDL